MATFLRWRTYISLLVLLAPLGGGLAAEDPKRCEELFSNLGRNAASATSYERDFGTGVFVTKLSATEYRVEPPPFSASSAREAQRQIGKLAKGHEGSTFTVTFDRMSEGEVLGFKAMISLDARVEADRALTAILLPPETEDGRAAPAGYESVRERALNARGPLLRRYDWPSAAVRRVVQEGQTRRDAYMLTVETTTGGEDFLLSLRLRSEKLLRDRTALIKGLLGVPLLKNATPEQLAHELVAGLKKSDKGITAVTLKVMAADVLIANVPRPVSLT